MLTGEGQFPLSSNCQDTHISNQSTIWHQAKWGQSLQHEDIPFLQLKEEFRAGLILEGHSLDNFSFLPISSP